MKVGITSDHRGYQLKEKIIKKLSAKYEIIDYGTSDTKSTDYPIQALKLGEAINNKEVELGIGICGTGIGISIALNKIDNIRAAKVNSINEAKATRNDNDANVIALAADMSVRKASKLITAFLSTPFSKDVRHLRRLNQIKNIEGGK